MVVLSMDLSYTDAQSVRRSVVENLRGSSLPLGDAVSLDALIDPCLAVLGHFEAPRKQRLDLLSHLSAEVFITSFSNAVRSVAAHVFDSELAEIDRAIRSTAAQGHSYESKRDQLEDVDVIIETWVERIAANDRATAQHSRAVGAWSHRIASRLALASEAIAHVSRCGTIHDVGKLHTPPDILLAARKLSTEEWQLMQRHVIDGWDIVSGVPILEQFADAVRGHHERFDGRGYPDNLGGTDIALSTRIVTVADSFNAMIADRPYRPPMSPLAALSELEAHRGGQFDPDCVDAMKCVVLGSSS